MIRSAHRFHGHASLNFVYRHGSVVRGPLFAMKYATNDRRSDYRMAVVVSKKVSKSAVTRNRIRRRIYEITRRHEPEITGAYDIVVTVFGEIVKSMPAEELERAVVAQLRQAGIVNTQKNH